MCHGKLQKIPTGLLSDLPISHGKSVTYMNDRTSLKSVRKIRRTDNL